MREYPRTIPINVNGSSHSSLSRTATHLSPYLSQHPYSCYLAQAPILWISPYTMLLQVTPKIGFRNLYRTTYDLRLCKVDSHVGNYITLLHLASHVNAKGIHDE